MPQIFSKRFTVIGGRMSYLEVDYSMVENINELYSYSDKDLLEIVEAARFANKQIETENEVFLRYLRKADPDLLHGIDSDVALRRFIKKLNESKEHPNGVDSPVTTASLGDIPGIREDARNQLSQTLMRSASKIRSAMAFKLQQTQSQRSVTSRTSIGLNDRGPKININIKTDMVDKEMDILLDEIGTLKERTTKIIDSIRYRTEEALVMLNDINESRKILENDICIKSVNPITGKIPPEKWVRYMQEWFKHADYIISKLRLKNVTSKEFLARMKKILIEKKELNSTLTPIDFEQLKIKIRILQKTYDTKTMHVYNLKRSTGKTNLQLTFHKKHMLQQYKELKRLETSMENRKNKINLLIKKERYADKEVSDARREWVLLKLKTNKYEVKTVQEYANAKNTLFELKRDMKKWQRSSDIQQIALETCIQTLKRFKKQNHEGVL